ncbi:forkhead associated domain (FHA) and phosphopeptide binding site containing protein [Pochonia chlamydosporia 170]|uniref:Forkhead associated domain (FHA) and phosphopeptide binding site containing protein n=1 Tax=Pochonia chlamydosporia 170 TaxID=1380566 RepID=A0A179FZR0_METCM|nr:forkhead associated domain (FHA) and phosphopeptide binding site containing protein [Pochonia chlamydosporia 170]OAQ70680.1 forkhead associated domain (FHA) and phosphopeptide binding site containing protein [Pochonia chlamydosporia 170]
MAVQPTYWDEVQVVLKAADPKLRAKFSDRYIFLTKDNPKVMIGRSTKRDTRLAAGAKNGWFDSAVMSRNHARLIYLPATKTVALVDAGSLHGTYVNDKRVNVHQFRQLYQNDTIRFGIAISKGSETFPPCEMKVTLNHGSRNPEERPVVFKVPDSSDGEDDISDIDDAIETSVSLIQKSGMAIEKTQVLNAIDLTGEEAFDGSDADPDVTVEVLEVLTPGDKESEDIENRQLPVCYSVEVEEVEENDASFSPPEFTSSISESDEKDLADSIGDDESSGMEWDQQDGDCYSNGIAGNVPPNDQNSSDQDCNTLPPLVLSQPAQPDNARRLPSNLHSIPIPSSSRQTSDFNEVISTESLGAKSGKAEFFQAREYNRRVCFGSERDMEDSQEDHFEELEMDMENSISYANQDSLFSVALPGNCTNNSASAALLAAGEQFLQTPVGELPEEQSGDDCLDDTSAYTYEMSKRVAEAKIQAAQPRVTVDVATCVRGGVDVSDLAEEHPDGASAANPVPPKRKADEISEILSEEMSQLPSQEIIPGSSQTVPESNSARPESTTHNPTPCVEGMQTRHSVTNPVDERPVKRLRRVAEVVGYAALGGVAVMSALIATAPAL